MPDREGSLWSSLIRLGAIEAGPANQQRRTISGRIEGKKEVERRNKERKEGDQLIVLEAQPMGDRWKLKRNNGAAMYEHVVPNII